MNNRRRSSRKKFARRTFAGVLVGGAVILLGLVYAVSYLYEQLNDLLVSYGAEETRGVRAAAPAYEEEDYAAELTPAAVVLEDYLNYDGELELPVSGATGYAPVKLEMRERPDESSAAVKTVEAGAGFTILNEQGDWWEVGSGGETGFVRHDSCMINLPDVIPSIRYNATNTYNSRFASSWYAIPNITGESLYPGRTYNERLGKEEYIVAVMYAMSKKIQNAQRAALLNGDCLVIYEGFRPLSVQRKVALELRALSELNENVYSGLNTPPWSITWFISAGVSNHQRGCSIDVGLVQATLGYAVTGGYKYLTHARSPFYYNMPTPIHELSLEAAAFAHPSAVDLDTDLGAIAPSAGLRDIRAARDLQAYCVGAGMTPLASQWWHFDDLETRAGTPGNSVGDYILADVLSVAPDR